MTDPQRLIEDKLRGVQSKGKGITEDDIPKLHDLFMSEYGWIPLEEFRKLPIPTLWSLTDQINNRNNEKREQMEKANKRRQK